MKETHKKTISLIRLAEMAGLDYQKVTKAFQFGRPQHLKPEERKALITAHAAVHESLVNFLNRE